MLIVRHFGEGMATTRLKKSNQHLKQFDWSIIKTLGGLEGTFEAKNRIEIIPIIVMKNIKIHDLLERAGMFLLRRKFLLKSLVRLWDLYSIPKESCQRTYYQDIKISD